MAFRLAIRNSLHRSLRARPAQSPAQSIVNGSRFLSSSSSRPLPSTSRNVSVALGLAAMTGGIYWYSTQSVGQCVKESKEKKPFDYKAVAADIANILENNDYDDGSYGPLFVRLAWHASGTYSKIDGTGGSYGATMRFKAESSDNANSGLGIARNLLQDIKNKYPVISYGDLWTLAGVVAIKYLGGPSIPWRPGRKDALEESSNPPVGRLPDATKDNKHLRDVFYRMGFDDRDIVALSGAHVLGRCHPDRSGFKGPWSFNPTMFTNDYFKLLLSETWQKKKWEGPLQYEDKKTKSLMMLPTDMWLIWDKQFKKYTEEFAKDEKAFFSAFNIAFAKLLELGCKFEEGTPVYIF